MNDVILASASPIRAELLERIGLRFHTLPARVDEASLRDAMVAENAPPRDIADALAQLKAVKISAKHPDALVIGCDQVSAFFAKGFG